jgi:hypothetical protein
MRALDEQLLDQHAFVGLLESSRGILDCKYYDISVTGTYIPYAGESIAIIVLGHA